MTQKYGVPYAYVFDPGENEAKEKNEYRIWGDKRWLRHYDIGGNIKECGDGRCV